MAGLASRCFRHAPWVIAGWLLALAGLVLAAQHTGAAYRDTVALPAADSTRAAELLPKGDTERVVIATTGTIDTARDQIEPLLRRLSRVDRVTQVVSPYAAPELVSADRRTAVILVNFDAPAEQLGPEPAQELLEAAQSDNLTVGVSGQLAAMTVGAPNLGNAGIGLLAAAIVLLITFGSLTCVVLPVVTAAVSVGSALAVVVLLSHVLTVPKISTEIAALLGLGVGVDYALFVLTRYRQGLRESMPPAEALQRAAETSGRSVVFAGVTVCVSLAGMFTVGLAFLDGIAITSAAAVALTMLAALTLLPALLRLTGMRKLPRHSAPGPGWAGLARSVTRRPAPYAIAAVLVIAVLAAPALVLRLGVPGAGHDPPGSPTKIADTLLAEGFGPGANAQLVLVTDRADAAATQALREIVATRAGVSPPQGPVLTVTPRTGPDDPATAELVTWLREVTGPGWHVGGAVAVQTDFSAAVTSRLPLFLAAVVAISVLLLALVFRSVLIPLTAAVMNLLTAGATLGVVVAVFGGPIEPYLPVFLFAGLFGLSMDYEVFLISRIQEDWRRTGHTRTAIVEGLVSTGRTITAAALIMALVFAAFAFVDSRVVREAGVGLTVAVLVDAVVIRCLLVPAVMVRLGAANWWPSRRREHPAAPVPTARDKAGRIR
ncbi:membrane protein [Amycolatopsis deserti]|uniref:Membrane protein n=1 Tax=Amycolatopsis deserti TaxID=185696 RepID=A0ABQ3J128_9PSEU|nr:MMPL family transporter [Amycolatopsis deserti]GHF00447.1 membrane protein [Amycolatopsis deserti]